MLHRILPSLLMWTALATLGNAGPASAEGDMPDAVLFNRDIRPILSNHCYACHGPDENQRQADLRLDLEEAAKSPRGGSPVILPGKPEESELFLRVASKDESLRMPPEETNKPLSPRQIELLRRWIAQGAQWQAHWSQLPVVRPSLPKLDQASSICNPVDLFIQARLRREGMAPSPKADPWVLARRLFFDLTGLPPTAQQVEAFVEDDSPDAYERLVDRLLAAPSFGERMAMHWLDLVRYADTNGIHGDNHREHWLFREYVIDAFNANMPLDRFTVEQLAGDLLEQPTRSQRIASGYNRLNMTTREGGAQAKEYLAKYSADRVRNVSSVWLGATMGCAECHDHKFDPFTMKDFYSMAAFFADIQETAVGAQQPTKMPTDEQAARLHALDEKIAPLQAQLDTQTPELNAALEKWEQEIANRAPAWTTVLPTSIESQTKLEVLEDGAIQATSGGPESDVYTLTLSPGLSGVTALRLEVLPDESLPAQGPGRAGNGNFVLNEITLAVGGQPVKLVSPSATHSQNSWPVKAAVDGKPETGWAILPQTGKSNEAVFEIEGDAPSDREWTTAMTQHYGSRHLLGKFRLSVTSQARPVRAGGRIPAEIAEILDTPKEKRTSQQQTKLAAHFRSVTPLLADVRNQLAKLKQQKEQIEAQAPVVLVAMSTQPRVIRILPRGNWLDDSGPVVKPALPEFLDELEFDEGRATRLDLAKWLVSKDNLAPARVFVNRLWHRFFGRGIVATLDDFGVQGAWPTHPELLDWLASEFVDSGWDVKRLVRLMATSHTYQQSSQATDEIRRRDPYNRLLARQGRFRLPAETVRDNALAVSGLLSRKIGGPSVKPYQPKGYWSHLNFPKRQWRHDEGESLYRRGLYTYWCRTFLHPSLLAFDAPSREECSVERGESNTPQQALTLLNDPIFVETARVFAERILREGGEEAPSRIAFAFREALGRQPKAVEVELLADLVHRHREQYRQDPEAAEKVLSVGEYPAPNDLDSVELASWTSAARAILNMHETIMRY